MTGPTRDQELEALRAEVAAWRAHAARLPVRDDTHGISFSGPSTISLPAHGAETNIVDLGQRYHFNAGGYFLVGCRELRRGPSSVSDMVTSEPVKIVIEESADRPTR